MARCLVLETRQRGCEAADYETHANGFPGKTFAGTADTVYWCRATAAQTSLPVNVDVVKPLDLAASLHAHCDDMLLHVKMNAEMNAVEKNVSCVFVRNISFGLDKQTVEDAFGEIGPVRNCFLVKEKGRDRHKGIGFVQFAIPEDADRAVAALNNTILGTRKILVTP